MKKPFVIALFMGFAATTYAQEFLDLKRYSATRQGGTARSMGMGGAIGATGIDFSVSSVNPSGLAQIHTSQAMGTIGLNFTNNNANYIDKDVKDSRFNFSVPNMGVVFSTIMMTRGKERTTGLINHSLAFGFNRTNDFNRNLTVDANNSNSSYLDYLAEQATKYVNWNDVSANGLNPFYPEELALAANAIVHTSNNTFQANLPSNVTMRQIYRVQHSGRQTDWNVSWAGNFNNVFYFGAGIGVPAIRFNSTQTIIERSQENSAESFEYTSKFNTSGTGINGKLGLTIRMSDWFRFGAAYHTPTAYTLNDQYSYSFLSRNFAQGNFVYTSGETLQTEPAEFSYKYTTPGKTVLSAVLLYKKLGMISVDYEVVNYLQAQSSTQELTFMNSLVRENLRSASNIRIGGEYNYLDYKFRAGFAAYSSPFKKSILNALTEGDLSLRVYSVGAGYQERNNPVFFDVAVVHERYDDFYTPYILKNSPRPYFTSFNKVNSTRLVFTIGTKF